MNNHEFYRKAKEFKVDEDGEVNDKFSGNQKQVFRRGWDHHERRNDHFYRLYANPISRYLHSSIGQKWNSVYSHLCKIGNGNSSNHARMIHNYIGHQVDKDIVMIDGVPHNYQYRSRRWNDTTLQASQLYVNPDTGILCITPPYKKTKLKGIQSDRTKFLKVGDVEFWYEKTTYRQRLDTGVFVDVESYCWFKYVPYTVKEQRSKLDKETNLWVPYFVDVRYRKKYTASKKEIKAHNLLSIPS